MNNNTFFSSKNKDLLYNICRDEIIKETEYNIDDNKKYYRTFGEIMKIVFKHAENKNNLTELNRSTLGKTIPYLKKEIEKKNLKNGPLLPENSLRKMTKNKYEDLKGDMAPNQGLPMSFRGQNTNTNFENVNVNSDYKKLMNDRQDYYQQQKKNELTNLESRKIPSASNEENSEDPKIAMEKMLKDREEYTLDSDSLNQISKLDNQLLNNDIDNQNVEVKNMNTYNSNNDEVDPMKLYQQYNSEREKQDTEYNKVQNDKIQFEEANRGNNDLINNMLEQKQNESVVEEKKFQENLSMKINDQMSRANLGELKGQLDNQIDLIEQTKKEIDIPTANDLKIVQNNNIYENNALFEEYKKKMFLDRKYINREHFITINSGDRDWFNNTTETRFNFQVKFNNSSHSTISRIFKNIVSFEMIRTLFAIENIILPYDNKLYIDYKSLPYMVLKIDEIDGLYSGTNDKLEGAFAHLLWDKDNTSEVLTSDYATTAKFSRVVKRGFCLMAPLGFEKKTYYPSPLASLQSLTINLMTPTGMSVNNHPDVLKIESIKLIDMTDTDALEVPDSHSFPYTASKEIIEITTHTYFSNRAFKIGDNIIIKGFVDESSDTFDITNFINRGEGHYIVNLLKEVSTRNTSTNEGFINKIFISPPGTVDYTSETTGGVLNSNSVTSKSAATTYFNDTAGSTDLTQNCKLINQSLQSNYVFKVVTREDDFTNVVSSANI